MGDYKDLAAYPLSSTRFHPTFAYEMIWNLLAFALIIYLTRRFFDQRKPGAVFFIWLLLAGLGRFLHRIFPAEATTPGDSWLSFTQIAIILMMLAGLVMLASQYGKLKLPLPSLPERYQIAR